jgi:hypothetical protein
MRPRSDPPGSPCNASQQVDLARVVKWRHLVSSWKPPGELERQGIDSSEPGRFIRWQSGTIEDLALDLSRGFVGEGQGEDRPGRNSSRN